MDHYSPDGTPEKDSWFSRKEYETDSEKKRDFWIGIGLFFGLNILLLLCQWGVFFLLSNLSDPFSSGISDITGALICVFNLLPWALNIGLIIFFAFTRSQIALGMLAGFGAALALVICLGVLFVAWCFYAYSGGSY